MPEGSSGSVQIDLLGLDVGSCKVAQASLAPDVPSGLSRSGAAQPLSTIWGIDASNVYAVGSGGTLLRLLS